MANNPKTPQNAGGSTKKAGESDLELVKILSDLLHAVIDLRNDPFVFVPEYSGSLVSHRQELIVFSDEIHDSEP